jgi:hypothetical protein
MLAFTAILVLLVGQSRSDPEPTASESPSELVPESLEASLEPSDLSSVGASAPGQNEADRRPASSPPPSPDATRKRPAREESPVAAKPPPGSLARGDATWYCRAGSSRCHYLYPDRPGHDPFAAAGPALRRALGPNWRGKLVRVSYAGRTTYVKLVDACGRGCSVVIDLYADAFARLAPTGLGRIPVVVRRG